MLAMHLDGLMALSPPRWQRGRPKPIAFEPDTEPPPSTTETAGPSPCSASPPLPGSSPRATGLSDGRPSGATTTSLWGSKPCASSYWRGLISPISTITSSPSCDAACLGTGLTLQHHSLVHPDLRRDTALHRHCLSDIWLDSCRDYPGQEPPRPGQALRQAPRGRLAPAPAA